MTAADKLELLREFIEAALPKLAAKLVGDALQPYADGTISLREHLPSVSALLTDQTGHRCKISIVIEEFSHRPGRRKN